MKFHIINNRACLHNIQLADRMRPATGFSIVQNAANARPRYTYVFKKRCTYVYRSMFEGQVPSEGQVCTTVSEKAFHATLSQNFVFSFQLLLNAIVLPAILKQTNNHRTYDLANNTVL